MSHTFIAAPDCPRWADCSAPICPLDPGWSKRVHKKGDRVCFYLRMAVKGALNGSGDGIAAVNLNERVLTVLPEISSRYGIIAAQLERAKKSGPKLGNARNLK